MDWRRLKRLLSPEAIPSWLIIIWKFLDWLDTMTAIWEWLNPTWNFLSSPNGTITLLIIGFGILIYLVAKPEKKRVEGTLSGNVPQIRGQIVNKDVGVSQELNQLVEHLDRLIVVEINYLDFRHIWNDAGTAQNMEPYLLFNLVIRNNTPIPVDITNCDGRATVDGDPCHYDIMLQEHKPIKLGKWGYQTPTLKQRLSADKGQEMMKKINAGEMIQFSLGSASLLVEDSDGVLQNRPIITAVSFEVDSSSIVLERSVVTKSILKLKRQ